MPFNFFAVVEVNKHTHVDDTVEDTTLKFYLECGNHHYASYMDFTRIRRAKGHARHYQRDGERLRSFQPANFNHKMRGQHPVTVETWDDYEIMGDTEPFMEDWP
eukprot:13799313-Heterocapsa_arctica.AAC.1